MTHSDILGCSGSYRPTVDSSDKYILNYAIRHGYGLKDIEYISLIAPLDDEGVPGPFELCRIDWGLPGTPITRNVEPGQ